MATKRLRVADTVVLPIRTTAVQTGRGNRTAAPLNATPAPTIKIRPRAAKAAA
jgi:hypothetical protein